MNILQVQSIRQQRSDLSDPQFITWANETLYTPKTCFVSYRSIRFLLMQIDPTTAKAKTEQMMAFVQQVDSLAHSLLLVPGNEKGDGGGIDVSLPDAQMMVNALLSQGTITAQEAKALLDLGRTARTRYADWGCERFGAEEMAMVAPDPAVVALEQQLPEGYILVSRPGNYDVIVGTRILHYLVLPTLEQIAADLQITGGNG